MPPLETADRKQKAVLWPLDGHDRYNNPKIGDPIELNVRWVGSTSEALDAEGNTITLDATVVVDRDISIDSNMFLGTLDDWLGTGSIGSASQVMHVKTVSTTTDLKNRGGGFTRRTVGLMRFKDTLPEHA